MDMLVRLYALPDKRELIEKLEKEGIRIHRVFPPNREHVISWVREHSSIYAAGEAATALSKAPSTIFIASRNNEILGYACYNATAPDFFGPTRVLDSEQGKGIGKALLLECMYALKEEGYGYAIIGSVGPVDFYKKCVNAIEIPDSTPALYENMLRIKK